MRTDAEMLRGAEIRGQKYCLRQMGKLRRVFCAWRVPGVLHVAADSSVHDDVQGLGAGR